MDAILSRIESEFAFIYIKNIVVYSKTPQEHVKSVQKVLSLIHSADISLELKKCKFSKETIGYLGHVILPRHWELAHHTADAIRGLNRPSQKLNTKKYQNCFQLLHKYM